MQIKNRFFPYPILDNSKNSSTYKDTDFEITYEINEDDKNLILKDAKIVTNNSNITELLINNIAKACLIVECSDTIYRNSFSIGIEGKDIIISKNDIIGKTVISGFIYANNEIEEYYDDDFVEEYKDYKFYIDKFDVLAIDNGESIKLEMEDNIDKKVSSIFSIIKNENSRDTMEMELSSNRINIYLPTQEFSIYDTLKNNDIFDNIIFSIIAIPALTQALLEIKTRISNGETFDEIEMIYNWFISIENAYEKGETIKLTEEVFMREDINKLAQKLLNYGVIKSIDDILSISTNNTNTEEGE